MKKKCFDIIKNKIFRNYIIILIISLMLEFIFRLISKTSILDWASLRIFIGCNIIALLLSLILSYTNNLVAKILIITCTVVVSFYALIQVGFSNLLGMYLSFGSSSQLGAVSDYIKEYLGVFKLSYLFLLLPTVVLVVYYAFFEKKLFPNISKESKSVLRIKKDPKPLRMKKAILLISLGVIVLLYNATFTIGFMQNKLQLVSNEDLSKSLSVPNLAVNQFGITMYGLIDMRITLFPYEEESVTFQKNHLAKTSDDKALINNDFWGKLIEEELNDTLNMLNNYYITKEVAEENEYTGIFKDKNLVIVMLESVNNIILDEELYPTIYEMYEKGWSWDNAYSPRNTCATGNNELSSVISLYPINNNCTINEYKDNEYPQSLYNLFNENNYTTSSYHNYDETFYFRKTIHENLGSQKYYDMNDLKIDKVKDMWPSDVELIEKSVPKFIKEDKFFSYILTVSAHHPYLEATTDEKLLNLKEFEDIDSGTLKVYQAKLKTVDYALETLIEELEKNKVLDDTIIMIFSDHYPYAMGTPDLNNALDYDVTERKEVDKTPFIIYNPEIESKKFEEYTTFMNITPTIANLFGLDYDSRLYAGEDIFSENYSNRAVFADGSWQDEVAYYDSSTGSIEYMTEKRYTEKEIIEINYNISNKIKMSNLAIEYNYFEYLYNSIEKIEDEAQKTTISDK